MSTYYTWIGYQLLDLMKPVDISRRGVLGITSSGLTGLVSGCVGDAPDHDPVDSPPADTDAVTFDPAISARDDGTDNVGDSPADAVKSYYEAILAEEGDTISNRIHSSAPMRDPPTPPTEELLQYIDQIEAIETKRTLVQTAGVDVTFLRHGVQARIAYHLKLENGQWTLWTNHPGVSSAETPIAAIIGDVEGADVTFHHRGGDELAIAELSVIVTTADGTDRSFELREGSEDFSYDEESLGDSFGPNDSVIFEMLTPSEYARGEIGLHVGSADDRVVFPRPLADIESE